jgi:hypothetical protein
MLWRPREHVRIRRSFLTPHRLQVVEPSGEGDQAVLTPRAREAVVQPRLLNGGTRREHRPLRARQPLRLPLRDSQIPLDQCLDRVPGVARVGRDAGLCGLHVPEQGENGARLRGELRRLAGFVD